MNTVVGKIVKPQGIRGEVKILPLVADAGYFEDFEQLYIDGKTFAINSCRVHEGFVYVALGGISDRDAAEKLRDKMVEVEKSALPELEDGEYYVSDLEGCELFFEDGVRVGILTEVANYGATDILVIQDGTEEIMCPLVDDLLVEVDIKEKKIILNKAKFLEVTASEN